MSFQAKFRLDEDYGNELVVLAADYEFVQSMDSQNLPNGRPSAGIVNVTLASGRDNKIVEWMVSPKMTKFVQIIFKGKDGSTIKLLELTNTYCVGYKEMFDADNSHPMKMTLKLSAWDIRVNIIYGKTNDWAEFQSARGAANIADSSINLPNAGVTSSEPTAYQNDVQPPADANLPEAEVPEIPNIPAAPAVPIAPAIPDAPPLAYEEPVLPGVSPIPEMPDVPGVPPIPEYQAPDMPSIPNVPIPPAPIQLPDFGISTLPGVPGGVPPMPMPYFDPPDLSALPDLPELPNLPELPKIPTPYADPPELPSVPSFIP